MLSLAMLDPSPGHRGPSEQIQAASSERPLHDAPVEGWTGRASSTVPVPLTVSDQRNSTPEGEQTQAGPVTSQSERSIA